MKLEFDVIPSLEKQIETVVLHTTEKAIQIYYEKNAVKEWMSIKEACEYIGVSFNSFTKLRKLGLRVCEIEGIKRVSKMEINKFLEEKSF